MVKKTKKKLKNIDYFNFNKGTLLLVIGVILSVFTLISKLVFGTIEIIYYAQIFGCLLIYFGLILHLVFIGDKPFFKSWKYIQESKKFIYAAISVFLFFALIGFLIPAPGFLKENILKIIYEIIQRTAGMSQAELISFIFLNNLQSSFFGIMLGFFFGIFPVISAIFNGYLLGFVSSYTVQEEGFFYLWRLFPHGIFELPAVFISFGLGIRFGSLLLKKNKKKFFRYFLFNSLRTFVLIIIPLLIISALIEGSLIFLFD